MLYARPQARHVEGSAGARCQEFNFASGSIWHTWHLLVSQPTERASFTVMARRVSTSGSCRAAGGRPSISAALRHMLEVREPRRASGSGCWHLSKHAARMRMQLLQQKTAGKQRSQAHSARSRQGPAWKVSARLAYRLAGMAES